MCGIVGFLQKPVASVDSLSNVCRQMTASIAHRGPDGHGVWIDPHTPLALGHRRLSIIDLSEAGAQPMISASGRYVLSFNGEIYNFQRLRKELADGAYPYKGHSDTEVILAASEQLGAREAIARLEGMFAVAVWDRQARVLTLARDRAGKKPLYYGWCQQSFLFGSELKALRKHPDFDETLDRDALGQYLQYGWVAQPHSIYQKIKKLPPGCFLEIAAEASPCDPQPHAFWSAGEVLMRGRAKPFKGSFSDAVDALDGILRNAVEDRMVADVDVGALLSGGIDSSMVVALMQRAADRPVKTFSIGFWEEKYNEAEFAASVAEHLGTEHHELYITPQQALDVIDRLPVIYDEPFADASQIPTYLVCSLAHKQVKVVLTGDGGDEQFAGYRRYKNCLKHWRDVRRVAAPVRTSLAHINRFLGERSWAWVGGDGKQQPVPRWAHKLAKLGQRSCNWCAERPQDVLANKFNKCLAVDRFVAGAVDPKTPLSAPSYWIDADNPLFSMLHYDYVGYLPEDILVKVDRASMAVSLESRSPLLDHRVLEFAWSLPESYLFDGKNGKLVLRELLTRYVPKALIDRPKRGFSVPVKEWLVGPLRDWAEALVSEQALKQQGIFDAQEIRQVWAQHLKGWANHSELIWAILMFQSWWQVQRQN
jgi:asparagine synthase (glutamine-hydrolysing)